MLTLSVTSSGGEFRTTYLALLATQLKSCGVRLIHAVQSGEWWFGGTTGMQVRDFELGTFAWVGQDEPGGYSLYACDRIPSPENGWSGQNYAGWCNELASAAIAQASNNALSQTQRKPYYAIVIDAAAQDVPFLPLFMRTGGTASNYVWEHIDLNLETYAQGTTVPATGATLDYTDYVGNQGTIAIPEGGVTQTLTLEYYPLVANAYALPDGQHSAGAFRLRVLQAGIALPGFTFDAPVTVTISYSDANLVNLWDKDTLDLHLWDEALSVWLDASESCPIGERYRQVDTAANKFTARVCHLSEFTLLGTERKWLYLPTATLGACSSSLLGQHSENGLRALYLPESVLSISGM